MASKTISLTDEVYEMLTNLKLPQESFGDVIKRLCLEKTAKNLTQWIETHASWENMSQHEKEHWEQISSRKDSKFTVNEVNFE